MRASRRGAALSTLGVALTLSLAAAPGARADEILVIPYSCAMAGGQPVLTPGPEQSHRVLGPRDQRKFSACSPVNPDMCREWKLHRFDIDCDGTRVPWVSVVAATSEGSRRAWLMDGRLVLRMGPWWSLAPDDPCAREPDGPFDARRMRRHCAERLAAAPAAVVDLPFGYAPMLGNGFIAKAAPGSGSQPPPMAAAPPATRPYSADPPTELFTGEVATPQWETPRDPVARATPAQPPPSAPPNVALQLPPLKVVPAVPPAPAAPPVSEAPAFGPPEVKPAEAKPISKPASPRTEAGAAPPILKAPPVEAARPAAARPDPKSVAAASEPAQPRQEPGEEGAPEAGIDFSLLGAFRPATVGAIAAFGGLALGLIGAFALARRREQMRDARRGPRDLAAVSLDGKRQRPSARKPNGRPDARRHPAPNAAVPGMARAPGASAGTGPVAEWGDRMPQSRAEALQVLGVGVAPSATETAIKKIVDGLRQSWHPDHARDEADRALRELRSKQINAAWDLLRAPRAASQRAEV